MVTAWTIRKHISHTKNKAWIDTIWQSPQWNVCEVMYLNITLKWSFNYSLWSTIFFFFLISHKAKSNFWKCQITNLKNVAGFFKIWMLNSWYKLLWHGCRIYPCSRELHQQRVSAVLGECFAHMLQCPVASVNFKRNFANFGGRQTIFFFF